MDEIAQSPSTPHSLQRTEAYPGEVLPGSDYSDEERVFLMAIERYKREHRRPYPTWREVLRVVHDLGYRKVPS
jgi:hypothetical protein